MDLLKSYLSVVIAACLQLGVFILANTGVITTDQAMALMVTLGIAAPAVTLRMPPPGGRPPSEPPRPRVYLPGSGKQPSDPPPRAARVALAVVAVLALSSCAGSLGEARAAGAAERKVGAAPGSPDRCSSLDSTRIAWGGIGKGAAVLAGGSGLSTLPLDEHPELQTGAAIGAAVMAAVAAGAVYVSESAGDSWARECSQP